MTHRVLVIDDDPLFLAMAEDLLISRGVRHVTGLATGADGLARIKGAPDLFDLILLDLNMPGLDGVNVLRALADLHYSGAVAIVSSEAGEVISSVRMVGEMIGIRIAGALSKPLRAAELDALIRAVPETRRAQALRAVSRADLIAVLDTDRLVPVYQPQISLKDMRVSGAEALLRLRAPDSSLVSGAGYLLAAETHGLITPLTIRIFEAVLDDLLVWRRAGVPIGASVNISPASLEERDLPDALSSRVRAAGLKASDITLEVTENRLLDFGADTLEVLSRLRIAGFRLSVDDFGTGATSIDQLRRFPFTELKVDKAFVQGAENDAFAHETLTACVRLASLQGLRTVAEGIETPADLKRVQTFGLDVAQGYLISRPLSCDDFLAWMGRQPSEALRARVA